MTAPAAELATDVVPRKRRSTELFLLLLALLVGVGAYVSVGLGYTGDVPADIALVAGIFVTLIWQISAGICAMNCWSSTSRMPV